LSVRFTDHSSRQIDKALDYIRTHSPSGADNVSRRISEAIDLLNEQPRAGRQTSRTSVRRLVLSPYPYVMFYRILEKDDVLVLRFVHAARRTS
jgi:plasmid stabilization system protein ParE